MLEIARINRILKLRSAAGMGRGMGAHRISAKAKARIGVIMNRRGEEVDGRIGSLIKSFNPSANG